MSIYEGLSEPTQENFLYASKQIDEVSGELTNSILNSQNSGWRGIKNKMLELIAPINPFHLRQHSHPLGYNVYGPKNGNFFEKFTPYPFHNDISFGEPDHYDPTKDIKMAHGPKYSKFSEAFNNHLTLSQEKVPYVCEVKRKELNICKLVNGDSKCTTEADNFLQICPNFALRTYRENKLFNEKAKVIQRNEYKEAMKVGSYNKGRTVGDVSRKSTYSMGMAANLRPDSMWVDDRYINVTQEDINRARAKLKGQNADFDFKNIKGLHSYSTDEAQYSHPPRMY
jgi:hypothetical protein